KPARKEGFLRREDIAMRRYTARRCKRECREGSQRCRHPPGADVLPYSIAPAASYLPDRFHLCSRRAAKRHSYSSGTHPSESKRLPLEKGLCLPYGPNEHG